MPIKFVFLILPQVHLLDLAGPDQVIAEAIDLGAAYSIEYCSIQDTLPTSTGLILDRLKHYSQIKLRKGDYLIIPGSKVSYITSGQCKKDVELSAWLQKQYTMEVNLVSICVGAYILGYAGLLNHIECTTHFQLTEGLQKTFPLAKVKENILFAIDDHIYTSAGIASGIDLMLYILEQLTDPLFAHRVARALVVYHRRDGDNDQENIYYKYRNHIHQDIHCVQDHLIHNIHKKHSLQELAHMVHMSERNFSRVFKKVCGVTVVEFINQVRLEMLHTLMANTSLSHKQIARKLGLNSEKQVQRLIKLLG